MTRNLLGWATFLSNLVLCVSLAICLVLHRPLRRKMGLLGAQLSEMVQALEPREVTASTSKDGLLRFFFGWRSFYIWFFICSCKLSIVFFSV
jgi:sensor histidine kinase regulating citrate/malate metabolism